MSFSERAKTIALAIVKIFETSKPFGNYSAVAVLNDGAGISYGVSQFTHKSGSLWAVIQRFDFLGGTIPASINALTSQFFSATPSNIKKLAANDQVKAALRKLGKDPLMQQAQREIAFERYLKPAIDAAEGSNFTLPLSLAVIYDSMNHGSFAKIRDRVQLELPASIKPVEYEKEWVTQYVKKRDQWLESIPRLAATDYRTDFFLAQIARDNWNLDLPINVHGFKLTEEILFPSPAAEAEPQQNPQVDLQNSADSKGEHAVSSSAEAPSQTQIAENIVNAAPKTVPDNFVPETKTVNAPAKEGSTGDAVKITIAGFTVPPLIAGIFTVIKQLIADGYLNAKEVGDAVVGFVFENTKYVLMLAGLVIVLMLAKKLFKQITLWLQMWIVTDPNRHDVEVKQQ
jgi:hypothetical protein